MRVWEWGKQVHKGCGTFWLQGQGQVRGTCTIWTTFGEGDRAGPLKVSHVRT